MKEIHVSLAHCLGPGVFAAIFRNSSLGIRFVRFSAVILHSTMKLSQNWDVSDGPEGWYFFLIVPLADCWHGLGDRCTITNAGAAWTVTKSTTGLQGSCNRGGRCTRSYISICFRWQGSSGRLRTYHRSSAVRGWLRWSHRWPVWWQKDQQSVLEMELKYCLEIKSCNCNLSYLLSSPSSNFL